LEGNHPIILTAFLVLNQTQAPAVGYRAQADDISIFYFTDVALIIDWDEALKNFEVYFGDGATVKHSMVRKLEETIIGPVAIQTQLTRCQKTNIDHAIFTHLGSQIVDGDEHQIKETINTMAEEMNIEEGLLAKDDKMLFLR